MKGSKVIELPEDEADKFDTYLGCVYKDEFLLGDLPTAAQADTKERSEFGATHHHLLRVYLLADKLGDVSTANMVVDEIVKYFFDNRTAPSHAMLKVALTCTPQHLPLFRLLLDFYFHQASKHTFEMMCNDAALLRQFLDGIVREKAKLEAQRRAERIDNVFESGYVARNSCHYHQHDREHPSCGAQCENGG